MWPISKEVLKISAVLALNSPVLVRNSLYGVRPDYALYWQRRLDLVCHSAIVAEEGLLLAVHSFGFKAKKKKKH